MSKTNLLQKKDIGSNGIGINDMIVRSMGKWLKVTGMFLTDDDANEHCRKNKDDGVVACFGTVVITANLYDAGQNVTVKE